MSDPFIIKMKDSLPDVCPIHPNWALGRELASSSVEDYPAEAR